ncbi:MAG TPA: HU family DNA-binding protein [Chloroflexota bacterium]|nr:HU family DNA-binding protein [Chloroflexota bacterium]
MAETVGKQNLITRVAQQSGLPGKQVEKTINSMIETVTQCLEQGSEVRLTGFGTFKVVNRAPRKGRHPRTGQEMDIPGASRPTFTPGSRLVDAARKGHEDTRRRAA